MSLLRIARSDLRGGWTGLGLLLVCLTLAVAGLAAVTSLASAIDKSIAQSGRELLGGDLLLSVAQREASEAELAALRAIGPLSRSTNLRASLVNSAGDAALAELSAIDIAWPPAGRLQIDGARPRGLEIVLDPTLARRLSVRRGDQVRLGGTAFKVSGTIVAMPRGGGFGLAPPALIDPEGLAATRLVRPGSLFTSAYRLRAADPEGAAASFRARFAEGGWRAVTRSEAGAGTRRLVDRMEEMLGLLSLVALAIGGVGIASAAAAFSASRRPRVAILKLVGASRAHLLRLLGFELAMVAILSIAIGLALGALAPSVLARFAGDLLPVPPETGPQWPALGLSALFGALVAFAASWVPLAQAVATPPATLLRGPSEGDAPVARWPALVAALAAILLALFVADRASLAASAIGAVMGLALLFGAIGWLLRRWARRPRAGGPLLRLGIAALDRPGAATARLTISLGLGVSLLVALAATASSLLTAIGSESEARAPALFLLDIPKDRAADLDRITRVTLPDAKVRRVPSLRGPVVAVNGTPVAQMRAIPDGAWILRGDRGLTFARDLPEGNRLVDGQWWPADYAGPPLVSIDVDAARALNLKVGDRMTIAVLGRPIEARIASLRQIDWRSLGFNFAIIFDPATLSAAPFGWMASIHTTRDTLPFERAMARELPMASTVRIAEIVAEISRLLGAIESGVRIGALFALLMGMIVLAGAVVATKTARARDIVLLRLVGATRGEAAQVQLIEFALIAGAAALLATLAGIAMAWAVHHFLFELPFQPDWAAVAGLPVAASLVAIAAALLAALGPLNARPAQGLRGTA